jgi:hypothetical protein
MEAMTKHRSHSVAFKRQVAEEFIAGETLHGLSKRHDISRQLIRIWVGKFEAGALDEDVQAADLLKEKLKHEWPAIVRWMLDGRLIWQRDRLGNATVIKAATSAYFEHQDAHRRWIDERCILDRNLSLKPGLLLADFNTWQRQTGKRSSHRTCSNLLGGRREDLRALLRPFVWILLVELRRVRGDREEDLQQTAVGDDTEQCWPRRRHTQKPHQRRRGRVGTHLGHPRNIPRRGSATPCRNPSASRPRAGRAGYGR